MTAGYAYENGGKMNKRTILILIKLIPVVSAALSFILIFSNAQAGSVATVSVILAFLGFAFFFVGRKAAKKDKTLKILGILDILSTVSIIVFYAVVFFAIAKGITDTGDAGDDSNHYAVEDREIGSNLGAFESADMDGNVVTEAIFADKDVTVLNVWATFCDPCIREMPDLEKLSEEFPDNVQVVGVVIDTPPAGAETGGEADQWGGDADNIDLARKICTETGVKYTNILASESVLQMLSNVEAVPTTFILDRSGNIISKPFVGADIEGYKNAVDEYLAGQ